MTRPSTPAVEVASAAALIAVLSALFWYVRIFASGVNPRMEIGPVDLYIGHVPMAEYGYRTLRAGEVPLWNPYQLCGLPFLAIPYVALFYPPHMINLFLNVLAAFEVSFVLHMFLGGFGMWLLARHFGCNYLGALCAALTFVWSGHMILNNILPMIFATFNWLPLIVLLLDLVLLGTRWSMTLLTIALTFQILLGATEVVLHNAYASAIFGIGRLVQLGTTTGWKPAAGRLLSVLLCCVAALLLAAPQLLPTIELVRQTSRGGGLTFAQVAYASVAPVPFLRSSLESTGIVTLGMLPILGFALAFGAGRWRFVSICAAATAVIGALLVFGGFFYRLYYEIPVVGALFRRPMKFLDIYSFGMSLLGALAVSRLYSWKEAPGRQLLRHPALILTGLIVVAALASMALLGISNWYWFAAMGALLAIAIAPYAWLRVTFLATLVALQGVNLFSSVGDTHMRPVQRPELFVKQGRLYDRLRRDLNHQRIYLSPAFYFDTDVTAKQGMLNELPVVTEYEPLVPGRYGPFFDRVSKPRQTDTPFFGAFYLDAKTRWNLLDLTGTRYFVMNSGEEGTDVMRKRPADFRVISTDPFVTVFEQLRVLPRVYTVAQWRTFEAPDGVLAALEKPDFDPFREALLEQPVQQPSRVDDAANQNVAIRSYEPEEIVVDADLAAPALMILTDLLYPGWKAFVNGREVPIYQANYLFRAVQLDAGTSEVRFEYRPRSFTIGVIVSAATALTLVLLNFGWAFRRHRV